MIYVSCGSSNNKTAIYNSRASNLVKRLEARIDVFDTYNLYNTKYFTAKVPKNWRTYLEPRIGEQIRLSPTNLKGKIIQDQYIWITVFESNNPEKNIEGLIINERKNKYNNLGHTILDMKIVKSQDDRGNYIKVIKNLNSNKGNIKRVIEKSFYAFSNKFLLITEFRDLNSKSKQDFKSIINSIEIK